MKKILFVTTLLILIITACASQSSAEHPTSTPASEELSLTPAHSKVVSHLSKELGVPPEEITLVSTEAVDWPNGCLGVQKIGVVCTQAIVPGYRFILEAHGKQYEYHTNQDMTVIRRADTPAEAATHEEEVIKQLAENLSLQEGDISVVSRSEVEFGDECLGVAMEQVTCVEVVTPGQIIVLEANDIQYEYHVSSDGARIQPATLALTWKREGGIAGFCDSLTVFLSGEVYGNKCKSEPNSTMDTFSHLLSANEQEQFDTWISKYGQVTLDVSDPAGVADRMEVKLVLYGLRDTQPSKTEQQQMFSWAQDLFQKLYS
jgi:hypothetical protein